jgi:hypothetical protein
MKKLNVEKEDKNMKENLKLKNYPSSAFKHSSACWSFWIACSARLLA